MSTLTIKNMHRNKPTFRVIEVDQRGSMNPKSVIVETVPKCRKEGKHKCLACKNHNDICTKME